MIINCPHCRARFKFDEEKIAAKGVKVRCTKCKETFTVTRDAGVVGEGNIPETFKVTRPFKEQEKDEIIANAVKNKDLRSTAKLGTDEIDRLVEKASAVRPEVPPDNLIDELESAVIKPKIRMDSSDMGGVPRPERDVQIRMNEDTYNRKSRVSDNLLDAPPTEPDGGAPEGPAGEVNITNLQSRIDNITSSRPRPRPSSPTTPPAAPPAGQDLALGSGPDNGPQSGTWRLPETGASGWGGGGAPAGAGGNVADQVMGPSAGMGKKTMTQAPGQGSATSWSSAGGPAPQKTRKGGGGGGEPVASRPRRVGDPDGEVQALVEFKTSPLAVAGKILAALLLVVGVLIGATAFKMGDRFDIAKLTPQVVLYEVFGVGAPTGGPAKNKAEETAPDASEDPMENLL